MSEPQVSLRQLYDRRSAAEFLGCSIANLLRLEEAGRLKSVRLFQNGRAYFRLSDLQALLYTSEDALPPTPEKVRRAEAAKPKAGGRPRVRLVERRAEP